MNSVGCRAAAPSFNGRSVLLIQNAMKSDDGTYMCVAENSAGMKRAVAAVRVKGQPIMLAGTKVKVRSQPIMLAGTNVRVKSQSIMLAGTNVRVKSQAIMLAGTNVRVKSQPIMFADAMF